MTRLQIRESKVSAYYVIMADIWFTSDFHLGHFNIIRYCKRPFADTREMNAAILERLNALVKPDDVLYFLGDFCMGGPKAVTFYRDQIACKTIHFPFARLEQALSRQSSKGEPLYPHRRISPAPW